MVGILLFYVVCGTFLRAINLALVSGCALELCHQVKYKTQNRQAAITLGTEGPREPATET
jgi:hypothetical protein